MSDCYRVSSLETSELCLVVEPESITLPAVDFCVGRRNIQDRSVKNDGGKETPGRKLPMSLSSW